MAFWGIEVKPAKPVTHYFDSGRGRLRITQATLGIGNVEGTTFVQCNVGNKSPVFLCALLSNKTESCHLDLEFEEADDVIFSALGPRTIYLTGYYVGKGRQANVNSDTESYGEDIVETETGESCHDSDEDTYEDSFINDGEPDQCPPSPASSNGVEEDVENLSDDKLHDNGKGNKKKLRKKYQISESEDEDMLQEIKDEEIEDEDNCLLSALKKKSDVETNTPANNHKNEMLSVEVPTEEGGLLECEKTKKRKQPEGDKEDKANLVDVGAEAITNMKDGHFDTLDSSVEEGSKHAPKSKKIKHSRDTTSVKSHDSNHDIILKEGQLKQDAPDTAHLSEDPIAVDEDDKKPSIDKSVDGKSDAVSADHLQLDKKHKKKKKKSKTQEDGMVNTEHPVLQENGMNQQSVDVGDESKDPIAVDEDDKKPSMDKSVDGKSDAVSADDLQLDKKHKKKKKKTKTQEDGMVNTERPVLQENGMNRQSVDVGDESLKAESTVIKTLSNGLIIEELATGEPDGKLAAPGKKIKVNYTGKLKENGQVFLSNVGKSPYKFRLGDEDIIEGWNLGLDGMRVGEKRRLTIPPSMGYGSKGDGENIPPNSWLVYDIELVGVRR